MCERNLLLEDKDEVCPSHTLCTIAIVREEGDWDTN